MQVLTLWIALTIGGGDFTVDLGGSVLIPVPLMGLPSPVPGTVLYGFALSPFVFIDPDYHDHAAGVRHELGHVEHHWERLGPAFLLSYALTLGRPFEDYLNGGSTWVPPPDSGLPRCPVFRFYADGASFMPCWRLNG